MAPLSQPGFAYLWTGINRALDRISRTRHIRPFAATSHRAMHLTPGASFAVTVEHH